MSNQETKEFTLPFVGREEELHFLFREYDQMLHAQYRSVWIEAPAGVGKTTLVEEFLRRIGVGAQQKAPQANRVNKNIGVAFSAAPLQPCVIHTHLRERSSNSLLSLVEDLASTLQTLSDIQQEKIFEGLTSFYRERAKKIISGGNLQSMDMEEGITTAGYVLKQLSKYFPLIVIIEDIHVLKGEMSFYALRQLQAITEHTPMMVLYLSRPNDEKQLVQFRTQVMKEGCAKYELGSLVFDDVEKLIQSRGTSTQASESVKKIMHLSGGNALLLRELLRSGTMNDYDANNSTTEKIIHYLTKELLNLPKKDRQVVAIAGMLGEEFSEQLLEGVSQAKDFNCWDDDVLPRLERRGIVRRRKKVLTGGDDNKEVMLRMGTFSHALWWEAGRRFYQSQKKWKGVKWSKIIVPLLSSQKYPLLNDAVLVTNLFRSLDRKLSLKLLEYVYNLCLFQSRWSILTHEDYAALLAAARECIEELIYSKTYNIDKTMMWMMVRLLVEEQLALSMKKEKIFIQHHNSSLIQKLVHPFLNDEKVLRYSVSTVLGEGWAGFYKSLDYSEIEKARRNILTLKKEIKNKNKEFLRCYCDALCITLHGFKNYFRNPSKAALLQYQSMCMVAEKGIQDRGHIARSLSHLSWLAPQTLLPILIEFLESVKNIYERGGMKMSESLWLMCIEVDLHLRYGNVVKAAILTSELEKVSEKIGLMRERVSIESTLLNTYSIQGEKEKCTFHIEQVLLLPRSLLDDGQRFMAIARPLFYLEEWHEFDMRWRLYEEHVHPTDLLAVVSVFEMRILGCLLSQNNQEADVLALVRKIVQNYPITKNRVGTIVQRIRPFLELRKGDGRKAKRWMEQMLSGETMFSNLERAFYSQLFARIGVKYGHDPKLFSNYVRYSLSEFEKLKIPKRVLFTAQKFYEEGLLPETDYKCIAKKYRISVKDNTNKSLQLQDEKSNSMGKPVTSLENIRQNDERGIKLCCFGELTVYAPDGKELVSRWWGKRERTPSVYKRIVLELVRAKLLGRNVTSDELIRVLFADARRDNLSKRSLQKYRRLLSTYLPQLQRGFLPYSIIEKKEDGYSLHPTVRVDILEAKQAISKAKALKSVHLPSGLWLLTKSMYTLSRGDFAQGIHDRSFTDIRREADDLKKECSRLLSLFQNAFHPAA